MPNHQCQSGVSLGFPKIQRNAGVWRVQYKNRKLQLNDAYLTVMLPSFVVENDIKNDTQLISVPNQRQAENQPDLFNFILNKSSKALSELISVTWKMHSAPKAIERQQKCRLDVVVEKSNTTCVDECNGTWLVCARQVLRNNSINIYVFADALRECLKHGPKKNNNILLTGPKSFLLNPV